MLRVEIRRPIDGCWLSSAAGAQIDGYGMRVEPGETTKDKEKERERKKRDWGEENFQ